MKKLYLPLTAILFSMFAITSCKTAAINDPKAVAKAFMEALIEDDFDAASNNATKESKSTIEMFRIAKRMADRSGKKEGLNIMEEAKGKTITYSDPKMDGTERATISVMADGKEVTPLILKKEDGIWKVAYDIASIMDVERSKMDAVKPGIDQADSVINNLGTMTDSISDALNKAKDALDSLKPKMSVQ